MPKHFAKNTFLRNPYRPIRPKTPDIFIFQHRRLFLQNYRLHFFEQKTSWKLLKLQKFAQYRNILLNFALIKDLINHSG